MNNNILGNSPVFARSSNDCTNGDPGISVRDYFSAIAMEGIMSSYAGGSVFPSPEKIAEAAVKYADALIAELSGEQKNSTVLSKKAREAIDHIEALYPPDSEYEDTAFIGRDLMRNVVGNKVGYIQWRTLPEEDLIALAHANLREAGETW